MSVTIPTVYVERFKDVITLNSYGLDDVKVRRLRNCNTPSEEIDMRYIRKELRL